MPTPPAPLDGRVALVTGAGRGIGRATAVALAEAGASIIASDLAGGRVGSVPYGTSAGSDLADTAAAVEDAGGACLTAAADVRDPARLAEVVALGLERFGRLDAVVANAGIASFGPSTWQLTPQQWDDMLAVTLTGTWNTCRTAIPALLDGGRGGSIVIVSSTAGIKALPTVGHYSAAKHGLVGLMRSLALELAGDRIRVNTVHPGGTATFMTENPHSEQWQASVPGMDATLSLPIPIRRMEPEDIAHGIRWLVSDESRYVTGHTLVIDAGALLT